MDRRHFLGGAAAAALFGCRPQEKAPEPAPLGDEQPFVGPPAPYRGPNVILVRFGGGVRRTETVEKSAKSWCPFVVHELATKGVVFSDVRIADGPGVVTSHGQGTLYLL